MRAQVLFDCGSAALGTDRKQASNPFSHEKHEKHGKINIDVSDKSLD